MLCLVYRFRLATGRRHRSVKRSISGTGNQKQINDKNRDENQGADHDVERPESQDAPLPGKIWRRDMAFGMVMTVICFRHEFLGESLGCLMLPELLPEV